MPHEEHLEIVHLHPNFAAEVKGVDFSEPISDRVLDEIKAAMANVSRKITPQNTASSQ